MLPYNFERDAVPASYQPITWEDRLERTARDYDPSPRQPSYEEWQMIRELKEDWAKGINWEIEWQNTQDSLKNARYDDLLTNAGYYEL